MGNSLKKETPSNPAPRKMTPTIRIGMIGEDVDVFVAKYGPKRIARVESESPLIKSYRLNSLCLKEGEPVNLQIWALSPKGTEDSTWRSYARVCEGYVVLYDVAISEEMFQETIDLISLVQPLNSSSPIHLVGWSYSHSERTISKERGESVAEEHAISFQEVELEEKEIGLERIFSEIALETNSYKQSRAFGTHVKRAKQLE